VSFVSKNNGRDYPKRKMKFLNTIPKYKAQFSIFLIWLVNISGIIGIYCGQDAWFLPKTPLNLLLGAVLLYWNFGLKNGMKSLYLWLLACFIGLFAEYLGVKYGLIFGGNYQYGNNFGPKILGVPWMIGVNWSVLTFLTAYLSRRIFNQKYLAFLLGALLMVGLDFFIEPIAPRFDFWTWEAGFAPFQNFIAWFFLALGLQILVQNEVPEEQSALPLHQFLSQVIFFAFFYVVYYV
jgi:bisanhydrobacterioruberin hydratase